MRPRVRKERFLEWYFSDEEDILIMGNRLLYNLQDDNTFTITTEDLFNECEYIPAFITENYTNEDREFTPGECELI